MGARSPLQPAPPESAADRQPSFNTAAVATPKSGTLIRLRNSRSAGSGLWAGPVAC